MSRTHLWNPWASRCWPASHAEEQVFLDELTQRVRSTSRRTLASAEVMVGAGPGSVVMTAEVVVRRRPSRAQRPSWDRDHLTCVLTALRGGASTQEIFAIAPGMNPTALLAAYRDLEIARHASAEAWEAIATQRTYDALEHHGVDAAKLLPVPVARIWDRAYRSRSRLGTAIDRQAALVREAREAADHLIERLGTVDANSHERQRGDAVVLGRQLFNPAGSSLYAHSHFLAGRVGELSSVRVADLLGERRDDVEPATA